ncbi:hypothetical protein P4S72_15915 [Vibrio sp. PP-XX7]
MKTTLDHLPEHKQLELQTISAILRDTMEDYLQGKTRTKAEYRILENYSVWQPCQRKLGERSRKWVCE